MPTTIRTGARRGAPRARVSRPTEDDGPADGGELSDRPTIRATVFGFQGLGNLGDEMILVGIEKLLAPLPVEVTSLFGGPRLAEAAAYPDASRHATWRLFPTLKAMRLLSHQDLFIVGGGGLINDYRPGLIPRMLMWIAAARLCGARVAWVGVGVGPIRRGPWRPLARAAARLSTIVTVRDERSARLLGGPSRRIRIIPDPALFLDPPRRRQRGDRLGIIVRPPVDDREPFRTALVEQLRAFADAGRDAGLRPHLLMMAPVVDAAFAAHVADRLARDGERPPVDPLPMDPDAALDAVAGFRCVVSVRLHGVFLCALAGVPCVPIGYDMKVGSAAERLGLGDLVVDPDEADPQVAARALAAVQDPARARAVADRVASLRSQAGAVRNLLVP